jgi:hypothetical protein
MQFEPTTTVSNRPEYIHVRNSAATIILCSLLQLRVLTLNAVGAERISNVVRLRIILC